MYVDVILPLPLDGVFTYSVPSELERQVAVGHRVLVPFGRNKTYVGIVAKVLFTVDGLQFTGDYSAAEERLASKSSVNCKPSTVNYKDVLQVLDASPILLDSQLNLWRWISDYYLSPIGEVYKAALPAGLKAEDGYRPKTETYIRLTPKFRSERALHIALDMLQRAPSQQKAFIDFLDLAMFTETEDYLSGITRDERSHRDLRTGSGAPEPWWGTPSRTGQAS